MADLSLTRKHVLTFFEKNSDPIEMSDQFEKRLNKITIGKYSEVKIAETLNI